MKVNHRGYRMPWARWSWSTLLLLFVSAFLTVLPAQGEWYVTGQTGVVLPDSLSNVTIDSPTLAGGVNGARVADVDLQKTSLLYGAKIGFFLPKREWIGIETEAFRTQLNLKQQTVVGGVPGRVFADTLPGSHIQLTTWAINLIVRNPSLVAEWEPYGGVGPAVFFASTADHTRATFGLNLVAGARYFVTPRMALFGEFKYDRATIQFAGTEGKYSSQVFVFGISMHFDRSVPSGTHAKPSP